MKKLNTILFLLGILLLGCTKTQDKVINKETIEDDYQDLSKNGNLTGKQDTILNTLVKLSKGRSEYIKFKELDDDAVKLLVDEEEYISSTNMLFEGLKSSKITYGLLLSEVSNFEEEKRKITFSIDSIFDLVDKKCTTLQIEVDSINNLLNGLVDFKLNNIGTYTKSYRDYAAVSLLATNKAGKPIEAISFSVTFYDKLDDPITTIHCSSSTRFSKVTTMLFEYEQYDYDRRDIYKALVQTTMNTIGRIEPSIRKINLDGEIIGRDQINFKYESQKKQNGYCPYFDESDELIKSIEMLELRKERLISSYISLNKITETTEYLISADNLKKYLLDALKGK